MTAISYRDQLLSKLYDTMSQPPVSTNSRLDDSLERQLRKLVTRKALAADPIALAEAQGRLLADLAYEQQRSLHEIVALRSGIDVLYTDDVPEDGFFDPVNPLSGNPTICVPKYVHRALQLKALLDHYKDALDRPLQAQIYGDDEYAVMRFEKAQAAFSFAAASQGAELEDPATKNLTRPNSNNFLHE